MTTGEFELPVTSWMVSPVYTIAESARLAMAARLFDEFGVSALPVLDASSRLTGVISKGDLIRAGRLRSSGTRGEPLLWLPDKTVVEFMLTSVPVVRPQLPLWACAARMVDQASPRLYVTEDGPLEGVVSTREMVRAVSRSNVTTPIAELGIPSASIAASAPLSVAHAQMAAPSAQCLIVHNADGVPVGVFSRAEARASIEASPEDSVNMWMDARVISFSGKTPTREAAEKALLAGCRYGITRAAEHPSRVVSGLAFASVVTGGEPAL